MNNLKAIINELQNLNSYELYRLSEWIRNTLNQPQKNHEISNKVKIGDLVPWFNYQSNSEQLVIVESKGRTKITIKTENGDKWDIPYYTINPKQLNPVLPTHHNKLTKNDFSIGENVEFIIEGKHYNGKIIKLNPKTATIQIQEPSGRWRVSYCLLTKLIDSQARVIIGELI